MWFGTCHVRRCSSPTAFAPLGARLGGTSAPGESSLAMPLMIFMTTQEPSNWGSKWILDWFPWRTSPKLGLDLSSDPSHTISVHVFLNTWVPNARLRSTEQHQPQYAKGVTPPSTTFSGEVCAKIWPNFWVRSQNLVLSPLKPFYGILCCDEKPYKCTGSEWHQ